MNKIEFWRHEENLNYTIQVIFSNNYGKQQSLLLVLARYSKKK